MLCSAYLLPEKMIIPGSSKGRTPGSGPGNRGSNPCPGTMRRPVGRPTYLVKKSSFKMAIFCLRIEQIATFGRLSKKSNHMGRKLVEFFTSEIQNSLYFFGSIPILGKIRLLYKTQHFLCWVLYIGEERVIPLSDLWEEC
ncbi:MAG: hypothetical protein UX57_C0009G0005 [Candidatus Uhrbacteria bacterium GW2011_GWE2_46_68]|uniref:Uncharacterized protein n=2 Tax=Candidatus Uhriibacteriota TaxID=1752732 RepID=A0A0G1SFH3_9BACT|nr:MAG: hypothetical protein UX45_C0006G0005 [Candidatus Uhrbacteria bacterium GW2011_GWF2_46_218]KKU40838.1 MAG: hypothetical protein UX57_C0009G0005 [Candidatus Uhrbacteria bacterium GW2011_GWE2_46_68]